MNPPGWSKSKATTTIETLLYLAGAFWVGAVHAATPGHGKTIAAAYIVGARGKPRDALILGIFVTLSHTSGIVLVGLLASLGSSRLMPQRIEAWLALFTGVLVVVLGLWTLWTQRDLLRAAVRGEGIAGGALLPALTPDHAAGGHAPGHDHAHGHAHDHDHAHGHDHTHGQSDSLADSRAHSHAHDHTHAHAHDEAPVHSHAAGPAAAMATGAPAHAAERPPEHPHAHPHGSEGAMGWHSHGWGVKHTHTLPEVSNGKMNLWMLIGLGIAGGLLPDPAALAILLSALAQGKVMLGLATVLVFSIGFAATLVVVGVVAAQVGRRVLDWLSGVWAVRVQVGTSMLILLVGVWLTISATKTLNALQ